MPQVLKKVDHLDMDPERLLQRATLAAMIAIIAVQWTKIENALAELFVGMLAKEEEAALTIYLQLIDRNLRKEAFNALSRTKLTPESHEQFQELYTKINKYSKKRNRIVHGWWAISNDHLDGLILIDLKSYHKEDFLLKQQRHSSLPERIRWAKQSWERIILKKYDEKDFRDIVSRFFSLQEEIAFFRSQAKFSK